MEIRADITADDYRAFLQHAVRRASTGARRTSFGLLVAVWAAIVVLFTWLYTATPWAPGYILSCGVGIVVGMLLSLWGVQRRVDLSPEEGGYVLGPRVYTLDENGVRARSAATELWVGREAIRALEETPDHIFVYLDRGAALIVPRRAFATPQQAALFVAGLSGGLRAED
jgi:hypothetical protein